MPERYVLIYFAGGVIENVAFCGETEYRSRLDSYPRWATDTDELIWVDTELCEHGSVVSWDDGPEESDEEATGD